MYHVISYRSNWDWKDNWVKRRKAFQTETQARIWAKANPITRQVGFFVLPESEATTEGIRAQLYG